MLTYTYNNYNELTGEQSVANPVNGGYPYNDNYDEVFGYDLAGNPTTFRGNGSNTFNSDNQLFNSGFGYDGNGNPLSYAGNAMAFDPENRATSLTNGFTSLTATYDGFRGRIRAIRPTTSTTPRAISAICRAA